MLDFVQFCCGISERIAGKFFIFPLINSAFGYEFRGKMKNLQSASSGSARKKLYKVELFTFRAILIPTLADFDDLHVGVYVGSELTKI